LVKNIEENLKWFEGVKIFEVGKVFFGQDRKIGEKIMLAGGISSKREQGKKAFLKFKRRNIFSSGADGHEKDCF